MLMNGLGCGLATGQPTQFVYPAGGEQAFAQMVGQTLTNAYIPLPGGGFAIYGASGLAQYNHADWAGSARVISTPSRTKPFCSRLMAF